MSVSLQLSKLFALQTQDTSVKQFNRFLPAVGEKDILEVFVVVEFKTLAD